MEDRRGPDVGQRRRHRPRRKLVVQRDSAPTGRPDAPERCGEAGRRPPEDGDSRAGRPRACRRVDVFAPVVEIETRPQGRRRGPRRRLEAREGRDAAREGIDEGRGGGAVREGERGGVGRQKKRPRRSRRERC